MSNIGTDENIAAEIIRRPAAEWLTEQYLPYAMYVIRSRALVEDDGLKPVQRRIIWSMFKKGITHTSKHLKAARAAADAVAYHPHGATSVEDALARMAQGFSMRVPLIDPYGSVGVITGDTAAAARYWEARLSREAMELVKEVSEGAVPLGKNFDGELDEPSQLPVRWPTSIINGTQGIAVGYASNMFSHNPDEVMDACRKMLRNPEMTVKQLLKVMPGPDMPTGGELLEIDGVESYYSTGAGRFTIRGKYVIENLARGKVRIVFTELPYQVSPADIRAKIRDIQTTGKLKEIANVKDLSDKKNGLRLVIETKAGTNHLAVLNSLFKLTNLEAKFSVNNTVLIDGSPVQTSMLDLIRNFVDFRKVCTINKAKFRLGAIDKRLAQLQAILSILVDIDKAIKIIRQSDTTEDARQALMAGFSTKKFTMTQEQADYILSMQLRRLTKQDSLSLQDEQKNLQDESVALNLILTDEAALLDAVEADLVATKKIISSKRRTTISGVTAEELKEEQKKLAQSARDADKSLPCSVTLFANGKILRTDDTFSYTSSVKKLKYGPILDQIAMKTQDSIVIIGSDGIGRRVSLSYVAPGSAHASSKIGVDLPKGVSVVGIAKSEGMKSDVGIALGTKKGFVKISKLDFPKSDEFTVISLDDDDEVVNAAWLGNAIAKTWFSMISRGGNILVFAATDVRPSGAKAGGVRGQKLKGDDDEVISFSWVKNNKDPETLIASQTEKTIKITPISEIPTKGRGSQGVALHGFGKNETQLRNAHVGTPVGVVLSADSKTVVPLPPVTKRAARGVDFAQGVTIGALV